jgi:hypothetical protein
MPPYQFRISVVVAASSVLNQFGIVDDQAPSVGARLF